MYTCSIITHPFFSLLTVFSFLAFTRPGVALDGGYPTAYIVPNSKAHEAGNPPFRRVWHGSKVRS